MDIKKIGDLVQQGSKPEYLLWVGCAGSFDARAKKVVQALAKILQHAQVDFAVLGQEEKCTGDAARRAGNEFLFQMLALQNIETMNGYGVKKIITTCPHCYNTLKNEYPTLGGHYQVFHHTQVIADLLATGQLKIRQSMDAVAYHDSCYLGRINQIYDVPRNILHQLVEELKEAEHHRENSLCCGAGGAQMFKEEEAGFQRINQLRTKELLATGARKIVANCPFCLTMIQDGLKAENKQDEVMVYDLAELVIQNMDR